MAKLYVCISDELDRIHVCLVCLVRVWPRVVAGVTQCCGGCGPVLWHVWPRVVARVPDVVANVAPYCGWRKPVSWHYKNF